MNKLQVLRTIDKFDKIGRDGVVELLQKPEEEFGANLLPVQAELIGDFLDVKLDDMPAFFAHAAGVMSRIKMMALLEDTIDPDGGTKWDKLLSMRQNEDQTWNNGGRPENIGWALDDMIKALAYKQAEA